MIPRNYQEVLKKHLQNAKSSELEDLAAALLGRLLDLPIAVAKSGFQHGADAGPAGQQSRRFRLECKAYSGSSSLNERQLLGEIDQALARDEAIEAWLLVATCTVSEQIRQSLDQHGERLGVPVVIIDWLDDEVSPLAALCAFDPDRVKRHVSKQAADAARHLQIGSADSIDRLRRTLQAWCLGFASIRTRSHERLLEIWNSPRESNAALGQDAAGGAQTKRIRRQATHDALNEWWNESTSIDGPAVLVGFDGAGKTWATLDWLVDSRDDQPIVLTIPSTATQVIDPESIASVKQLLAESLHDLMGARDQEHWLRRLDRLLARPSDEGPVLTVFFDGLNQNPPANWLRRLKILQGQAFAGRIRVTLSTRHHHYTNTLSSLRSLVGSATRIDVGLYDTAPGGELDSMLALEGLTRNQLHPDVLRMARTPRLFNLVVRLRKNLSRADQVTVHRLLWEYGRDTIGVRGDMSFSADEWNEWLKEIANKFRAGIRGYSLQSLSKTVARSDLTESEVAARLSDIIDGDFVSRSESGDLQPQPLIVAHALGAALLNHLYEACPTFERLDAKLATWLDPISGFDQKAEILRAALSILIELRQGAPQPLSSVLVTCWLRSQNLPADHQSELTTLAPTLLAALLDAIEHSDSRAHTAAQHLATRAIRSIPRSDRSALNMLVARTTRWLSTVSRDTDTRPDAHPEHERRRHERFVNRIGHDSSGPTVIAGIALQLVDRSTSTLPALVPSLLDGFPLASASPIFETAAAAMTVADSNPAWPGLKWLCLLNPTDPDETTQSLRTLSVDIRLRPPEPGIRQDLPARVAALLLWLTGHSQDDKAAHSIDPDFYHTWTYSKDYLPHPATSLLFPLERRHADAALQQTDVRLHFRLQRTRQLWLDPEFAPHYSFTYELQKAADSVDVTKLNRKPARTIEDHGFEVLARALARCNQPLLAGLIRRKLRSMSTCPAESRYWAAMHATDHMLFCERGVTQAARTLRLGTKERRDAEETFASTRLLLFECANPRVDAREQFEILIDSKLDFISDEFADVLRSPKSDDVDTLVQVCGEAGFPQQRNLLILLSLNEISISEASWKWIRGFTNHSDADVRRAAFKILTDADPARFGSTLEVENWSWRPDEDWWINEYGTRALIRGTLSLSFESVATRIAPWRLLYAARRRGSNREETRLAAKLFGRILVEHATGEPDALSDLSVDRTVDRFFPFVISIDPRPSEDQIEKLRLAFDGEAQVRIHQHALDTTLEFMQKTRQSGFYFYLVDFKAEDYRAVLRFAPELVDQWIEGHSEPTAAFQRRVWYAEGAFLGLCETLLAHDPSRGKQLWRALRLTLKVKFVGACGIDDLVHMAFRAPESTEVTQIRSELLELRSCNTDRALCDIAIAACYNNKSDWLSGIVEADGASQSPWRPKRGNVLAGFTVNNTLPVAGAWPEGEVMTDDASLACKSARSKWIEACARHWWEIYLETSDPATAYASWVLFLQSADRRADAWVPHESTLVDETDEFLRIKILQYRLNRNVLSRAFEKRDEKLEKTFLGRSIVAGLGPWAEPRQN